MDTDPKSDQNKLMDVIRHTLANTESPTPEPEIQEILERLQQMLRENRRLNRYGMDGDHGSDSLHGCDNSAET